MAATLSPPHPVAARPQAAEWQIWTGLWIVYIVWGSTYLAIRVVVETVPPFLSAGGRFMLAGAAMLAFLAWRAGRVGAAADAPAAALLPRGRRRC